MISRVAQGSTAENLACQYLETRGLVLVRAMSATGAANWT